MCTVLFVLMFSVMTPIYIPQPVIHFSTGWHGMLFLREESGIYVYCYDAMTDFYSLNGLWYPEKVQWNRLYMLYSQEDLIAKKTSLYVILQAFHGFICIPTHSNCWNSEHFYPSELG